MEFHKINIDELLKDKNLNSILELLFGSSTVQQNDKISTIHNQSEVESLKQNDDVEFTCKIGNGVESGRGKYIGCMNGMHYIRTENGIKECTQVSKIIQKLTKQEATNKVSNILETQLNPKIIQKIVDIIDRIQ